MLIKVSLGSCVIEDRANCIKIRFKILPPFAAVLKFLIFKRLIKITLGPNLNSCANIKFGIIHCQA